jgi:hypothetical protein
VVPGAIGAIIDGQFLTDQDISRLVKRKTNLIASLHGIFAILVEVIAYPRNVGFDPLFAATAWGFSGALLPLGMLSECGLDGIIDRRRSVLLTYIITLAGLGFLWLLRVKPSVWMLGGFVVCRGTTLLARPVGFGAGDAAFSAAGLQPRSLAASASGLAPVRQLARG